MLEIHPAAEDLSMSGEMEEEGHCYTDLQPVSVDMRYLIPSSTDPCLTDFFEGPADLVSCVECVVETEGSLSDQQGCFVYTLPHSPQSLHEDECSVIVQDLLPTGRLYDVDDSNVYVNDDDDDDDASVMLDFMDLSFLDEDVGNSVEVEGEADSGHSFIDSLEACPTVIVATNPGGYGSTPDFKQLTGSSSSSSSYYYPLPPTPSPSDPSQSPQRSSPSPSPPPHHLPPCTLSAAALPAHILPTTAAFCTFTDYCDLPPPTTTATAATATTITTLGVEVHSATSTDLPLPPSPPDSTSTLAEMVSNQSQREMEGEGEEWEKGQREATAMDFETFDNNSDDENDEEADYKPYCHSRRGAKRNLLWKFLLWTLDHHSDVVCWTNVEEGTFKFVDTARVSTLWGQRKKKADMTFEKLSRGIRHYYKRGLMERLSHTRLVYKFNWDMVPRRYRKA
ncbi:uncharacterized protein LOC143286752 [Babylonia areolata]|uniref:uncharacterized protein LOC143286752 n=1 Tax=Babylonia areolata TaxID=304850 RepID=UPI003FD63BA6